ncbi:3-dehydroquinate synthase [Oscillibacter sp. GMB15532]|uniref:3-dehydroquinate synthase n=1 Tax=Oscillibacter sp. GMB15532 TaxID=3230022 RepID=UPI0034DF16E0
MESTIQTILVNTKPKYTVSIGPGLLAQCGELAAGVLTPCRAAIVTDSTVAKLYLARVEEYFQAAGFSVCAHVFPAGEEHKNLSTLSEILEFLAGEQLTRSDCVVALGGGVCGDMAGFAAGCYLRGVKFIQLPTTFLSAVDSSVGGKTAVDLRHGKNLAGLFLQPSAVVCDTDCLQTLSPTELADGAAEAIKTGVLSGEALFSLTDTDDLFRNLKEIITRCVAFKATVVEQDELDNGVRRTLNLGHTAGHAIEACSNYGIRHGHAVAAGLAIIARASEALGWAEEPCAARICAALQRNNLPTGTDYSPAALARAALADKKRRGGEISLVIPQKIGKCEMKSVPVEELESIFAAGWENC